MGYFVKDSVYEYRNQKEKEKDEKREKLKTFCNLSEQYNRTTDKEEHERLSALMAMYR